MPRKPGRPRPPDRLVGASGRGGTYTHRVEDAEQAGRFGTPLPVDNLFRVLLPVDRGPVGTGLCGAAVEEAGGEQRGRLVGRTRLLEEVAGGALAQSGGEALGEAIAPGELGEGGDDARVEPGRPAAHPPGRQRDPGEQPVPARVGKADLLLGRDPQPVIHSLCTLGRGGGDTPLHRGGMAATAAQEQPGDPADEAARQPAQPREPSGGGNGRIGDRAVQPPYETAGGGYIGVGGGARTRDDRGEHRP